MINIRRNAWKGALGSGKSQFLGGFISGDHQTPARSRIFAFLNMEELAVVIGEELCFAHLRPIYEADMHTAVRSEPRTLDLNLPSGLEYFYRRRRRERLVVAQRMRPKHSKNRFSGRRIKLAFGHRHLLPASLSSFLRAVSEVKRGKPTIQRTACTTAVRHALHWVNSCSRADYHAISAARGGADRSAWRLPALLGTALSV